MPADCILIEEMNITVDQSIYNFNNDSDQEEYVFKECSIFYGKDEDEVDNHEENPDPFLMQDSKIMTG